MQVENGEIDLHSANGDTGERNSQAENLIGQRIRQIRLKRRMSATELGDRVGISRSMVSQIELGRTNASVSVLKSIAGALAVPLFTLFVEDRSGGEIVRRHERATLHIPGSDIVRELLVPDTHRKMTLISAVFAPGNKSSYEPSVHQGEECMVVIRGQITIYYNTDVIHLSEGDSFYFDPTIPHIFANDSDEEAEIIASICG